MNTVKNLVLKEDFAFWVSNEEGRILEGEQGFYCYDTRYLNRYNWHLGDGLLLLLSHSERPDRALVRYAKMDSGRQTAGIVREIAVLDSGFTEMLEVKAFEEDEFSLFLEFDNDFRDIFEVRSFATPIPREIDKNAHPRGSLFRFEGIDRRLYESELAFSGEPVLEKGGIRYNFALEKGETRSIRIEMICRHPDKTTQPGISYEQWRDSFPAHIRRDAKTSEQVVLKRAVDDMRALLLHLPTGPYPSAGIPWFVAAFGRDALITALMMLPYQKDLVVGVLRFLASRQGVRIDQRRAEEPGKILHEIRFGEATKRDLTPHSPYYGTLDATPLFIILLGRLYEATGNEAYLREFRGNWEAALLWMEEFGDADGDGFLEFRGDSGSGGLTVQSWKDSGDSMHHQDGTIAAGAIVPVEVQGYAYEAYLQAEKFYRLLGNPEKSDRFGDKARTLKERFHRVFWLEDLQTYAMALDGDKKPLRVQSSNPGHLFWNGIVPEETAPRLVQTLFSEQLWSGWGIRTLGTAETLYNPVSYHNGSVWPHDTAIIAQGLFYYGYKEEAGMIRDALFDLAFSQHDYRLPELLAGYDRSSSLPVPYPVACRPQAWDAAALLMLAAMENDGD